MHNSSVYFLWRNLKIICGLQVLLTLESSVCWIVFEHVHHVVKGDEGIVDGHDLGALGDGRSQDQTTDAAESVNSDLEQKPHL